MWPVATLHSSLSGRLGRLILTLVSYRAHLSQRSRPVELIVIGDREKQC